MRGNTEPSAELVFDVEDPRRADISSLLEAHLAFAVDTTPVEHIHALDVDQLLSSTITFFTARRESDLLAVGALNDLGHSRAELKSMHVSALARGRGVGRSLLYHLLAVAGARQYKWLGLETGTMDAFAPARRLYLGAGFLECEAFGDYTDNRHSICMSMNPLTDVVPPRP